MPFTRPLILCALVLLSACSNQGSLSLGALNPLTWVSAVSAPKPSDEELQKQALLDANTAYDRYIARAAQTTLDPNLVRVAEIVELRLDFTPRGAILRAQARTETPGYRAARLMVLNGGRLDNEARLQYVLMAYPSDGPTDAQFVTAATYITNKRLVGVSELAVDANAGSVTIRLR